VIPPFLAPYLLRAVALATVLAALAGLYAWRVSVERDFGREEVRAEWATERAAQHAAALVQSQKNAAETARRLAAQKEVSDAYERDLAAARRDAAGAAAVAGRLRDQLAARSAALRGAAGNPAAAGQCEAALAASDLHANLFLEADARAGALARVADAARLAGLACERAYEALTP
jgi:hypothetical protein